METTKDTIFTAFSESSTIVSGIIFGEILHRLYTRFLQPNSTSSGPKNKKRRRNTVDLKRISSYFDRNLWLAASISLFSYMTFSGIYKGPSLLSNATIWFIMRSVKWDLFICENDLDKLREDAPHQFGEGLAWSYWCGFLKFVLYKNESFPLEEGMIEFTKQTNIKLATSDFLVLLPESCNFPQSATNSSRITALEGTQIEVKIPLNLKAQIKRPHISLKVYQVTNKEETKTYTLAFECPNIIHTGLGTHANTSIPDSLRQRNLKDFRNFLQTNLLGPHTRSSDVAKLPICFLELKDKEWSLDEYSERLADIIVSHLEGNADLEQVISSDDCSDYE